MSDEEIDELGPVDYLVVEFPAGQSNFTGEMAGSSRRSPTRAPSAARPPGPAEGRRGEIEAFEIDDFEELDELRALEAEIAEILAAGRRRPPRRGDGERQHRRRVVWENRWAAPFASAARRAGGQLIASGRIPIQAIVASLEADSDEVEANANEGV